MGRKMKIFLSCGQRKNEKKDGLKISKYFNDKYKDQIEMLFAEEIFDSKGLTEVIYKNLNNCDGFIGIFHKREEVNDDSRRSSLFVNQELAIASYLKKEYFRTYSEENIKLEGVNKYLMNRDINFITANDIIVDLEPVIESWLETYKPNKGLIFNEPQITNKGTSGQFISQIVLELLIDNLDPILVDNFQIGIIIPQEIKSNISPDPSWSVNSLIELKGSLANLFETNGRIIHRFYEGKINRYMSFETNLNMNFSTDIERFCIGFYLINQNNDIEAYSMEFNHLKVDHCTNYFHIEKPHEIRVWHRKSK